MGPCSSVLYTCLANDLSRILRTLPYDRLERNVREAIWPGARDREVACCFLLDSILKKFEDTKSSEADAAALTKFLSCNSHCESYKTIDVQNMTEIQAISLGEFKRAFHAFFFDRSGDYILSPEIISERMNVGPGASVGVNGTSFYAKIGAGPLTGTRKSLHSLYKREAHKYPLWLETEKIRSSHFGDFVEVKGSRLSFVPKSSEISRTICTEPLLNMLVQKGIGTRFEEQLSARFGINLASQPTKNRVLAQIGSKSGEFGTIDLSSASDTISINLLREILPPYILSWLMESRSEFVTLPSGEVLPLQMVSSMGNAFTFPLQTILFSCVVIGVYTALGIKVEYPFGPNKVGNWATFGDDIIVRREAYDHVVNLLERLGFFVNRDKSYNEGPFRESCGSDFWSGYNVRGIYCRTLKSKHDVISLINRLNVWSANHNVYLPSTIKYLLQSSGIKINPVPIWESDVAGVKVPESWLSNQVRRKWKGNYGVIVYSRYLPRDQSISLLNVGARQKIRMAGRDLIHNPPAILFSAIGGYLRDGNLHNRVSQTRYQKRFAVAPCWDYRDPCNSTLTSYGWQNWKSGSVCMNLE